MGRTVIAIFLVHAEESPAVGTSRGTGIEHDRGYRELANQSLFDGADTEHWMQRFQIRQNEDRPLIVAVRLNGPKNGAPNDIILLEVLRQRLHDHGMVIGAKPGCL